MATKYTVLLLYPEDHTPETFLDHVYACSPNAAVARATVNAAVANEGLISAQEFTPLAVFEGHHIDKLRK